MSYSSISSSASRITYNRRKVSLILFLPFSSFFSLYSSPSFYFLELTPRSYSSIFNTSLSPINSTKCFFNYSTRFELYHTLSSFRISSYFKRSSLFYFMNASKSSYSSASPPIYTNFSFPFCSYSSLIRFFNSLLSSFSSFQKS